MDKQNFQLLVLSKIACTVQCVYMHYVHIRQQRNKRFPLCEALKYTKDANGARTKGLKTDKKASRDLIVIIISAQLRRDV